MIEKYDPFILLSKTVFRLEHKHLEMFSSTDPVVKEYKILIEIKESSEKFEIKADANYNAILFRGAKTLDLQNPDELEKNKNLLGAVDVIKKGEDAPKLSAHTFDAYWNRIN